MNKALRRALFRANSTFRSWSVCSPRYTTMTLQRLLESYFDHHRPNGAATASEGLPLRVRT